MVTVEGCVDGVRNGRGRPVSTDRVVGAGWLGNPFSCFSPRRVQALRATPVVPALSLPSTLDFSETRWTTGDYECWRSLSLPLASWFEDVSETLEPFLRR